MRHRAMRRPAVFFAMLCGAGCLEPFPERPTTPAASRPTAPKTPQSADDQLAGAHILIAYRGAQRSTATRGKAEALALARQIAATLQGKVTAAVFAAAARKHSDGPSGPQGGNLGTWKRGRMVPAFDAAIVKLPFDGVTREPVETPFGYHLIMRHALLPDIELAAAQVLIAHAGAQRAPASVTRDEAGALALCKRVAQLALGTDGSSFSKLVAQYSDDPYKGSSGRMGSWSARESPLPASINRAVHALRIGATSGPVLSPFGCHVLRRLTPSAK